ncbi:hypothetical protein L6164_013411 [Bauhinia variegata]|uniref:Uncharacterized protein n=1 Tax=Bauhinia variegata TaxID=167791 RepID=A0ACB9NFJ1_BAUVA|nr:hypothetical protein L6164_013411 [Bauhinia variegata]
MASSSSVTHLSPPSKHDVFLSFRGEDTRDNFTSHLHKALCNKKIETYIDNRIEKGDGILPSLLKAIEESEIFVIIFSKNYASSTWCLNELVKILEYKQKLGRAIVPVLYNVDPSDVRKQSGSYADAFVKHDQQFKDNIGKVQRWRESLTQVAQLSGWDSSEIR